jgi:hypothetical protein
MPLPITLQLPAGAPFRALAVEAASRICALAGGDGPEAESFGAEVGTALEGLAVDSGACELSFETGPASVEVRITCGARSEKLRRELPTAPR